MASKHKRVATDFDRLVTRREVMALINAYHRVYHRVYHGNPEPEKTPDASVTESVEVPVAPV